MFINHFAKLTCLQKDSGYEFFRLLRLGLLWLACGYLSAAYAQSDQDKLLAMESTMAVAQPVLHQQIYSRQLVQKGGQISMKQAINIAQRRHPGRVLSAKRRVNRQGEVVFRIKILSRSGEIRTIGVPANGNRKS